jgi:thiamine pyrophosphate-dependent acetolactate synthase large subunit-like protein
MADGYHRASGNTGVCTVTSGPGLTQVGTALTVAARNRSALVLFCGDTPHGSWSALQRFDQAAFAHACEAEFIVIHRPMDIVAGIKRAFVVAETNSRPVVVSVPSDVQTEEIDRLETFGLHGQSASNRPLRRDAPNAESLSAVVSALDSSRRPLIVAGRGAVRSGAIPRIRELAGMTDAILGTTLLAKGVFSSDPRDVGVIGGLSRPEVVEIVSTTDTVLALGASLDERTTGRGTLFNGARRIIVSDGSPSMGTPDAEATVIPSDVGLLVDGVISRLDGQPHVASGWTSTSLGKPGAPSISDQKPMARGATDVVDPREAIRVIDGHLPRDAHIVIGGGHSWAFPIAYLSDTPGRRWTFCYQFGAIGNTVALAIGVATSDPDRPVIVFDGDGSFMMDLQELDTAVRSDLNLLVVVQNDEGFGSERHELKILGAALDSVTYRSPDIARVARGLGARAAEVHTLAELDAAFTTLAGPGVRVLDLRIDPSVTSDVFRAEHME